MQINEQFKKNIFRATAWSIAVRLINAFLKFFSTPILLNHYGKSNFGLIGLAFSINAYLLIMDLGFNMGNIRFISSWLAEKKNEKLIKLIQSNIVFYGIMGIINVFVLIALSFFCQDIFNLSDIDAAIFRKLLYILCLTSFISWSWSITSHILRAYERIAFDERLNLLANILAFLAVIIAVNFKLSLTQYFVLYGISIVSIYPIRIFKCKALNPQISFKPVWHTEVFHEVFRYSIGIFLMGIFQLSAQYSRPLILGIQAGVNDVADYKIIEQVTGIILMFSGSFLGVLLPYITKMNTLGHISSIRRIAYDGTKYLSILLSLIVFGLILIAKPLLEIYVGKEYVHLSFWLTVWAVTLLGYHNSALSSIVLAASNIKSITYYSIFSSTTSLVLAWFLTPHHHLGGVVIAFSFYIILQLLFYYSYYIPRVMKLNSLQILFRSFLKPVLFGVISLGLSKTIMSFIIINNLVMTIFISGLIFTMFYIVFTLMFTMKMSEIKTLIK